MAFRFNECSTRGPQRFKRPSPTITAQKPASAARPAMFLVGPLQNLALRRFLRNLRSYTDAGAAQQR
jgi:hypothetical protein